MLSSRLRRVGGFLLNILGYIAMVLLTLCVASYVTVRSSRISMAEGKYSLGGQIELPQIPRGTNVAEFTAVLVPERIRFGFIPLPSVIEVRVTWMEGDKVKEWEHTYYLACDGNKNDSTKNLGEIICESVSKLKGILLSRPNLDGEMEPHRWREFPGPCNGNGKSPQLGQPQPQPKSPPAAHYQPRPKLPRPGLIAKALSQKEMGRLV